ncbi:hypothetical protein H072_6693 [Dactylellina haptotyla CBS 200.50]|uniref:C2H2-type domain-containing protein n=1 Tax=Dactylellina haptotyla (strain CBS 200.50) TaxID=1284197 RepID=S8A9M9_DACHA|nr:hypothetical protein H072_6693 [Dactylellina haptotyla CBS 200.50]
MSSLSEHGSGNLVDEFLQPDRFSHSSLRSFSPLVYCPSCGSSQSLNRVSGFCLNCQNHIPEENYRPDLPPLLHADADTPYHHDTSISSLDENSSSSSSPDFTGGYSILSFKCSQVGCQYICKTEVEMKTHQIIRHWGPDASLRPTIATCQAPLCRRGFFGPFAKIKLARHRAKSHSGSQSASHDSEDLSSAEGSSADRDSPYHNPSSFVSDHGSEGGFRMMLKNPENIKPIQLGKPTSFDSTVSAAGGWTRDYIEHGDGDADSLVLEIHGFLKTLKRESKSRKRYLPSWFHDRRSVDSILSRKDPYKPQAPTDIESEQGSKQKKNTNESAEPADSTLDPNSPPNLSNPPCLRHQEGLEVPPPTAGCSPPEDVKVLPSEPDDVIFSGLDSERPNSNEFEDLDLSHRPLRQGDPTDEWVHNKKNPTLVSNGNAKISVRQESAGGSTGSPQGLSRTEREQTRQPNFANSKVEELRKFTSDAYYKLCNKSAKGSIELQRFVKSLKGINEIIRVGFLAVQKILTGHVLSELLEVYCYLHVAYAMYQLERSKLNEKTPDIAFKEELNVFRELLPEFESFEYQAKERDIFDEIVGIMWVELKDAIKWNNRHTTNTQFGSGIDAINTLPAVLREYVYQNYPNNRCLCISMSGNTPNISQDKSDVHHSISEPPTPLESSEPDWNSMPSAFYSLKLRKLFSFS